MKPGLYTWEGFLDDFIQKHRIEDESQVEVMVTDEQCTEIGRFVMRGIVGAVLAWQLRGREVYNHSPLAGIKVEKSKDEDLIEDESHLEEATTFIN